jgi:hypothetical protein
MKIATVLNIHGQIDVVRDTIESIKTYVSDDIVVIIDGAYWSSLKDEPLEAGKVEGFYHNCFKSPYRNVALALQTISDTYPDMDWYCYTEYDALFTSERFKHNLKAAEEKGVWMLGNDGHVDNEALVLVRAMLKEGFKSSYYMLGCCLFFHRNFIKKLKEINFFDRFLNLTNEFKDGFFPFYSGYDLSEHMYPTLCRHFGGNIGVFAHYEGEGKWHGAYEYFPLRWRPDIDPEKENFPNASIIHPLKSFDHPIRVLHRERRKKWKNLKEKERLSDSSSTPQLDTTKTADVSLIS